MSRALSIAFEQLAQFDERQITGPLYRLGADAQKLSDLLMSEAVPVLHDEAFALPLLEFIECLENVKRGPCRKAVAIGNGRLKIAS